MIRQSVLTLVTYAFFVAGFILTMSYITSVPLDRANTDYQNIVLYGINRSVHLLSLSIFYFFSGACILYRMLRSRQKLKNNTKIPLITANPIVLKFTLRFINVVLGLILGIVFYNLVNPSNTDQASKLSAIDPKFRKAVISFQEPAAIGVLNGRSTIDWMKQVFHPPWMLVQDRHSVLVLWPETRFVYNCHYIIVGNSNNEIEAIVVPGKTDVQPQSYQSSFMQDDNK